jgi:hypothetical protein
MIDVIPELEVQKEMDSTIETFLYNCGVTSTMKDGFLYVYADRDKRKAEALLLQLKEWIDTVDVQTDDWSDKWK